MDPQSPFPQSVVQHAQRSLREVAYRFDAALHAVASSEQPQRRGLACQASGQLNSCQVASGTAPHKARSEQAACSQEAACTSIKFQAHSSPIALTEQPEAGSGSRCRCKRRCHGATSVHPPFASILKFPWQHGADTSDANDSTSSAQPSGSSDGGQGSGKERGGLRLWGLRGKKEATATPQAAAAECALASRGRCSCLRLRR